jgi:hypothetical protein
MLYSLSAITTFGHANLFLKSQWQLMGALEALNGMLIFGLTRETTGSLVTARTISLLALGGTIDTNGFNSIVSGNVIIQVR